MTIHSLPFNTSSIKKPNEITAEQFSRFETTLDTMMIRVLNDTYNGPSEKYPYSNNYLEDRLATTILNWRNGHSSMNEFRTSLEIIARSAHNAEKAPSINQPAATI